MVRINLDARVTELLDRTEANADAAAQVLLLAAEYMRAGKPLPDDLAEHIAGAFEAAMHKPSKMRGDALLLELHIKIPHTRPADVSWFEVGQHFDHLCHELGTQTAAATQTAIDFNISESTATRIWRDHYKPARKAHDDAFLPPPDQT